MTRGFAAGFKCTLHWMAPSSPPPNATVNCLQGQIVPLIRRYFWRIGKSSFDIRVKSEINGNSKDAGGDKE